MGNSSSQTEELESSEQSNPLNKSNLEEESNNVKEKLCPKDKSANVNNIVIMPPKFITRNDFIRTWFSWKKEFLASIKSIDKAEASKQMWGLMLLNHMGPVGQEIYRTFSFHDKSAQEDIDVLIKKFDTYCIYGDKRKDDKAIDKYINDLKLIAVAHNYADSTNIMKEKKQFNHLTEYCKIKYANDCTPNLERNVYDVQRWISWLKDVAKAIIYIGSTIFFLYFKQLLNMYQIVYCLYISCPAVMIN